MIFVQGGAQQANVIRPNVAEPAGLKAMPVNTGRPEDGGDPQSAFDDFWRTGGMLDEGAPSIGAQDGVLVSDPKGPVPGPRNSRSKTYTLLLLLLVLAAAVMAVYMWDLDPAAAISDLLGLESSEEEAPPEAAPRGEQAAKDSADSLTPAQFFGESSQKVKPKGPKVLAGNPYWALPNAIDGYQPLLPVWSAMQEEEWRSGIAHKYPYQRLKTVLDVRRNRRRGAQTILWEALEDKKAWPRLYAAIGLAEYNIPLANKILVKAIGRSRPELVAGFFERFVKNPNPGQAYILRQAIRLLDEGGRLTCLQGIWNSRDRFRDLYIAGATLDPGPRVKAWVQGVLLQRSMPLERFGRLLAMAQGKAPFAEFEVRGQELDGQNSGASDASDFDSAAEEEGSEQIPGGPADSGSTQEVARQPRPGKGATRGDVVFFDVPLETKKNRR